ncbi:MarR family winged helix-turn-helix transcriptional regulator [Aeromicrobium sp. CF3.5]|uniref:MarR family winged helix-turn-helix transcriptional regulator n=1 Tax=Aeromicrobium sp. CF3.5 TaxID=3373078 RepID=UPI003EE6F351
MAAENGPDHVDVVLGQWATERSDLDVRTMGVLGRLARLDRIASAAQTRTLAPHDLDAASFDVLATLRRAGEPWTLTPAELARSSMLTSGAVTQRLDRLEGRGWVRREPSELDGRSVRVVLTPAGRDRIDAALPDHLRTQADVLAVLSHRDRDVLAALLRRLLTAHDA